MQNNRLISSVLPAISQLLRGLLSKLRECCLSLRGKLILLFGILMAVLTAFFFVSLGYEYRIMRNSDAIVTQTAREIQQSGRVLQLIRTLRSETNRDIQSREFKALKQELNVLKGLVDEPGKKTTIESLLARLDRSAKLRASGDPELIRQRARGDLKAIWADVENILLSETQTGLPSLKAAGQRSQRVVVVSLPIIVVFFLLSLSFAWWVISGVVKPISMFSQAVDRISIEDNNAAIIPGVKWNALELVALERSFENLLRRLRGFRALNIRRLLIEKRRADIIAASTSDGMFLLRGHEIVFANPIGEKILALPADATWKGLNIASFAAQRGGGGSVAVLNAISRTIPVEFEMETEDKRTLHYLLHSYPISEEVIEQVEHSLDGPIDQILDRWQANMLVVAQDVTLVRESQEAKSHFIATLSHEVKTPVTSLTMATRLLKKAVDQIPNAAHRSLILTCAEDVDRLRGLIDDLLSVSRFDTLTQRLEFKKVDIAKLLKQSIQFFQPEAFNRGVEVSTELLIRGGCTLIPMDATKVSWALSNLLVNALRHAPRGGKVNVRVSMVNDHVEIRIRDNGPGIERSRQDRIFDKFKPFYNLRVARTGTVGMGLAIAREIITAHGGKIWVNSEPGKGAEFCFTLPAERDLRPNYAVDRARTALGCIAKGENRGTSARC